MPKKIFYIAGPITGHVNFNRIAFERVENRIIESGMIALNPTRLPVGMPEPAYMDICVAMVRHCDAVVMLNGWQHSLGAVAERALAVKLGKLVFCESDCLTGQLAAAEHAANSVA